MANIYEAVIDKYNKRLIEIEETNKNLLLMYDCLCKIKSNSKKITEDDKIDALKQGRELLGIPENKNRTKLLFGEKIDDNYIIKHLESLTEEISDLHSSFEQELKNVAKQNGFCANHVFGGCLDELLGDSLEPSKNRLTQFEQKQGDFVFASTLESRKNIYAIRTRGMIRLNDNTYMYLANENFNLENGFKLVKPRTVFKLDIDEFTPETIFTKSKTGSYCFKFDDEWYCGHKIKVLDENRQPVVDVEQIDDVTKVLDDFNIYISKDDRRVLKTLDTKNLSETFTIKDALKYCVKSGIAVNVNGTVRQDLILNTIRAKSEEKTNKTIVNKHTDAPQQKNIYLP